ncbi:MAG: YceD family protein [Pseudanabaenaceae cyanobacterium]
MHKVYIPSIARAVNATVTLEFKEEIPDLATLTPPQGEIAIRHCGNYLTVKAKAWAIVTLTCDRTLRQFNHRLVVDTEELIWLAEDPSLVADDLTETLPANGYFDPMTWLYEQFCLAIPFPQIAPDAPPSVDIDPAPDPEQIDNRWGQLRQLRSQLNGTN